MDKERESIHRTVSGQPWLDRGQVLDKSKEGVQQRSIISKDSGAPYGVVDTSMSDSWGLVLRGLLTRTVRCHLW